METKELIKLLKKPQHIKQSQTIGLKAIIEEYPYFQAARAIYLKGLKQFNDTEYNSALKIVASYTTDRSVLFDFITSDVFLQNEISGHINSLETSQKSIPLNTTDTETVTNDKIVPPKETTTDSKKPIKFNSTEKNSFNKWLNMTNFHPINREIEEEKLNEEDSSKNKTELNREEKFRLIEEFIRKKPKLIPQKKDAPQKNIANDRSIQSKNLMTETLAKIYIEQENYKKAIQSYKTLSLKYPEKSSLFADQIKEIKKLQKNKK